jgi:hypothetical protein
MTDILCHRLNMNLLQKNEMNKKKHPGGGTGGGSGWIRNLVNYPYRK